MPPQRFHDAIARELALPAGDGDEAEIAHRRADRPRFATGDRHAQPRLHAGESVDKADRPLFHRRMVERVRA